MTRKKMPAALMQPAFLFPQLLSLLTFARGRSRINPGPGTSSAGSSRTVKNTHKPGSGCTIKQGAVHRINKTAIAVKQVYGKHRTLFIIKWINTDMITSGGQRIAIRYPDILRAVTLINTIHVQEGPYCGVAT